MCIMKLVYKTKEDFYSPLLFVFVLYYKISTLQFTTSLALIAFVLSTANVINKIW